MLTSEIKVDVNEHKAPDIYARVGENNTRRVLIKPGYYDDSGEWVGLTTVEDSIRVQFRMVKPDNTFVVVDLPISIVEDPITFRVMLTPEMCQVSGTGYYDVRIGDGEEGEFLYTANGRFIIDDNMLSDSMIESIAAVNGLIFPDDFLTSADLDDYVKEEELEDYATKGYVDTAIAGIPSPIHEYKTTDEQIVGKWIDGRDIYEKTYTLDNPIIITPGGTAIQSYIDNINDIRAVMPGCYAFSANDISDVYLYHGSLGQLTAYIAETMSNCTGFVLRYTKV